MREIQRERKREKEKKRSVDSGSGSGSGSNTFRVCRQPTDTDRDGLRTCQAMSIGIANPTPSVPLSLRVLMPVARDKKKQAHTKG